MQSNFWTDLKKYGPAPVKGQGICGRIRFAKFWTSWKFQTIRAKRLQTLHVCKLDRRWYANPKSKIQSGTGHDGNNFMLKISDL